MRRSGILMPIFSLPSQYGIGSFGKEAKRFVDFLTEAGQSYWQILPINPTSFGDSPYQSFSSYAGNPYFIDLDTLCEEGLITSDACKKYNFGEKATQIDYGRLYKYRYKLLREGYLKFLNHIPEEYEDFCKENRDWLDDYALFMVLKDMHGGIAWFEWEEKYKFRKEEAIRGIKRQYDSEIGFYKMLQFKFYEQWWKLKQYANHKGIKLIGDLPIYVAGDSVDVWANITEFYLDKNSNPIDVAGCPPDAFSEDGQLWGNPLFDWEKMKKDQYAWWIKRMKHASKLYDVVRIDHFRGFDSYYAISANAKTARHGEWRKGPGMDFFNVVKEKIGEMPIIVEDLGFLTPSVKKLVADTGYPGMKVLQFAFDSLEDGEYLPHNYERNCVVYTGTHDNDTLLGWFNTAPKERVEFAKTYGGMNRVEGYHWGMMRLAWSSVSDLSIVPMQDLLGLASQARINVPSTLGTNWRWRMRKNMATKQLAKKVYQNMKIYARI